MQCSQCRAVYSNGLDLCPRCKTPAAASPAASTKVEGQPANPLPEDVAATDAVNNVSTAATPLPSTLIEFPGAARAAQPQWRKELSERVREIQERRAREAAFEAEEEARRRAEQSEEMEDAPPHLGLVPSHGSQPLNPIVAAALRRIERARQPPPMPRTRATKSGAATALARVAEERYQKEVKPLPSTAPVAATKPAPAQAAQKDFAKVTPEHLREHGLVVVPAQPATKTEPVEIKKEPKRIIVDVVADESLALLDAQTSKLAPFEEPYDDRAPVIKRLVASMMDFFIIGFASSPFAAIIELTNSDWSDVRVTATMGCIILLVMFLYLAASIALAGRTWGMSLVSLHTIDVNTGLLPTTGQAVGRALAYMISLPIFIGLLYALFDAEGRAVHDHLSGTAVVRD